INSYHDTQHRILFDMSEQLSPYLQLAKTDERSRQKVNQYLQAARYMSRKYPDRVIDESPEALSNKGYTAQEVQAIQSARNATEYGLQQLESVLYARNPQN